MKSKLKVTNVRGTIFVPRVDYNTANLRKMQEAFPGYLPSMISPIALPDFVPGMGVFKNNSWRLVSSDQTESISFYEDKIDIITNSNELPYNVELLHKQSQHFLETFMKIISAFSFKSSRLAIAPTLFIPFLENEQNGIHEFTKKIFAFHQFNGSELANCDFSQVYRVPKNLNGSDYLINHLTRFSTEMFQTQVGNVIHIGERLILAVDINTFVNPVYSFDEIALKDFYTNSPTWCEELLSDYFQNI